MTILDTEKLSKVKAYFKGKEDQTSKYKQEEILRPWLGRVLRFQSIGPKKKSINLDIELLKIRACIESSTSGRSGLQEKLLSIQAEARSLDSQHPYKCSPGMLQPAYNPSSWDVEVGTSEQTN